MLEKEIEKKLVEKVESMGGVCLKWVSPGCAGVPDRICILPGGTVIFVEVKAPGKQARPLQKAKLEQLKKLGCNVAVIDSVLGLWTLERLAGNSK